MLNNPQNHPYEMPDVSSAIEFKKWLESDFKALHFRGDPKNNLTTCLNAMLRRKDLTLAQSYILGSLAIIMNKKENDYYTKTSFLSRLKDLMVAELGYNERNFEWMKCKMEEELDQDKEVPSGNLESLTDRQFAIKMQAEFKPYIDLFNLYKTLISDKTDSKSMSAIYSNEAFKSNLEEIFPQSTFEELYCFLGFSERYLRASTIGSEKCKKNTFDELDKKHTIRELTRILEDRLPGKHNTGQKNEPNGEIPTFETILDIFTRGRYSESNIFHAYGITNPEIYCENLKRPVGQNQNGIMITEDVPLEEKNAYKLLFNLMFYKDSIENYLKSLDTEPGQVKLQDKEVNWSQIRDAIVNKELFIKDELKGVFAGKKLSHLITLRNACLLLKNGEISLSLAKNHSDQIFFLGNTSLLENALSPFLDQKGKNFIQALKLLIYAYGKSGGEMLAKYLTEICTEKSRYSLTIGDIFGLSRKRVVKVKSEGKPDEWRIEENNHDDKIEGEIILIGFLEKYYKNHLKSTVFYSPCTLPKDPKQLYEATVFLQSKIAAYVSTLNSKGGKKNANKQKLDRLERLSCLQKTLPLVAKYSSQSEQGKAEIITQLKELKGAITKYTNAPTDNQEATVGNIGKRKAQEPITENDFAPSLLNTINLPEQESQINSEKPKPNPKQPVNITKNPRKPDKSVNEI
jgi:hypothetical protein